jgi:hypothetical protein
MWLQPGRAEASGGREAVRTVAEFVVNGPWPRDGVLSLVVAWRAASLVDACVDVAPDTR